MGESRGVGLPGGAKILSLKSAEAPAARREQPRPTREEPLPDAFRPAPVDERRPIPVSRIHFDVHSGMRELKEYAAQQGWTRQGWTQLSIPWLELEFTTDGWKTKQTLKSTDVPSPIVNGLFSLPNVTKDTTIEFAIHVGLACHAPSDIAGYRERGDLWLNNGGRNFTQVSH